MPNFVSAVLHAEMASILERTIEEQERLRGEVTRLRELLLEHDVEQPNRAKK